MMDISFPRRANKMEEKEFMDMSLCEKFLSWKDMIEDELEEEINTLSVTSEDSVFNKKK